MTTDDFAFTLLIELSLFKVKIVVLMLNILTILKFLLHETQTKLISRIVSTQLELNLY